MAESIQKVPRRREREKGVGVRESFKKTLQLAIVLLNFKPFTYLFRATYAAGLKIAVAVLARRPAVRSVFGYGSFFEGRCLYGVSDIDFVILIDENFSRNDGIHYEIAAAYKRVRRFIWFLAPWHETAENLIFLSDLRIGFPVPANVRLRLKQGRLILLRGLPFPEGWVKGPVSVNEAVEEVQSLLRIVLMNREIHTHNLLFWKKTFLKLIRIAAMLGLDEVAGEMHTHGGLHFLRRNDVPLFVRTVDPDALFRLMLGFLRRIFKEVEDREKKTTVTYRAPEGVLRNGRYESYPGQGVAPSAALAIIRDTLDVSLGSLPSPLCGITPLFSGVSLDKPVHVIAIERISYRELRTVIKVLAHYGDDSDSFLIRVEDFLFLVRKFATYTDVMLLDPFGFANVYAQLSTGEETFEIPVSVYEEQKAEAERTFMALAELYKKNEGRISKLPFPCIYTEHDLSVLRDAFHRMRVFLANSEGVDIRSTSLLVDYLGRRHPACQRFLSDLLIYYKQLNGESGPKASANNLYRCLLRFMAQLLSGVPNIRVDEQRERLGITVGIITRNRATDLRQALESLTRQIRLPDEVLIVDNGSTDPTLTVIESFRERLPIGYHFLTEPSIPKARNIVIDNARHEIVSFTDDDCIAEPEWLDAVERGFLRAANVGIVGGWILHRPAEKASMLDTYYSLFHHSKP